MSKIVYVVEDDVEVRSSIGFMLKAEGYQSHLFEDGEHFLNNLDETEAGVVLLDIRMPNCDGFEVMENMLRRDLRWPVVAITGHGDVPIAVRAIQLGALDMIEKPFTDEILVPVLEEAFVKLEADTDALNWMRNARQKVDQLSPRELEVLQGLTSGWSNKEIADHLELSLRTVEMHRGNMMSKLGARTLADAVMIAVKLNIPLFEAQTC